MGTCKWLSINQWLTLILIAIMIIPAGCSAANGPETPALNPSKMSLATQPDQFFIVVKDGVEVACPKHWQTYSSDPSLIYGVSRAETIRIIIGVLPAADQSYYDGLVEQGTVHRTTIAGYLAYKIDYTHSWDGHQVTNWCITAVNGDKACHFMFLCDTSMMPAYAPIFEYVLNSLKFQQ